MLKAWGWGNEGMVNDNEMAQWVKTLVAKFDNLSLIPSQLPQVILWLPNAELGCAYVHMYTYTYNVCKFLFNRGQKKHWLHWDSGYKWL